METIDVMLPYYGDVELMKTAVRSVAAQDDPRWRLVVIDDAYPDAEPAAWFASLSDPRITYIRNETNLGARDNFTKALELAEADVFVMMGADDVMLPSYLRTVSAALRDHPEVSAVQPGVEVIDGSGRRVRTLPDAVKRLAGPKPRPALVLGGEQLATSLLHAGWHYFPSLAWRTESVRRYGFSPEYNVVQDLALLLDIAADGGSVAVLRDPVFQYRRHAQSDSSVRAVDGRRFIEERTFFQREAERFRSQGWAQAARAAELHWTSRLHALSVLLRTARHPRRDTTRLLGQHVLR